MILITVGSTQFPFARMNALVARLSHENARLEKIIFQYGSLAPQYYTPPIAIYPFIAQDELLQYMKKARVVICHGGPGTIYQALSFGKIPWVLPRQKRYGEHLTDHQVQFSEFMAKRHLIRVITDDIPVKVLFTGNITTKPPIANNGKLIRFLHQVLK